MNHKSSCSPSQSELKLFKSDELNDLLPDVLDTMSLATFSAATALVSIVLAAFSKAFT